MKFELAIIMFIFAIIMGLFGFFLHTVDTNRTAIKMACIEAMKANTAIDCKELVK